jgi:predicted nucleic acid-binding protein
MALVLDTGVVYAALDADDDDHERCAALLAEGGGSLVIPEPVCVEVDYWVRKNATVDAWLAFCEDVVAGAYTLWSVDKHLMLRAAQLQVEYADQPIGFVDASVFATCEVLGEEKVATLDHRHFGMLKTTKGKSLHLLPE